MVQVQQRIYAYNTVLFFFSHLYEIERRPSGYYVSILSLTKGPLGTIFDANMCSTLVRILEVLSIVVFYRNAGLTLIIHSWSVHVPNFL